MGYFFLGAGFLVVDLDGFLPGAIGYSPIQ
jgi:hypothetical protein